MKIVIRQWNGREIGDMVVDAVPCGVPGLAVHAAVRASGWVVTHVPSGCRVAWFPDASPEYVLACAQALGELGDWTAGFPAPRLAGQALGVIGEFGAITGRSPVPRDILAAEIIRIKSGASQ